MPSRSIKEPLDELQRLAAVLIDVLLVAVGVVAVAAAGVSVMKRGARQPIVLPSTYQ